MKRMGQEADVPIIPDEQSRLLEACTDEIEGVIGGGVPGGTRVSLL
jgi:phosphomevalonate kinase